MTRRTLGLLLALLVLAGCGGAPEILPEAERDLEAGRLEAAEKKFRQATRQYLTETERERVADGLAAVAAGRVEGRLKEAVAKPGRAGLEAIAEVRRWLHQQGGGKASDGKPSPGDQRVVAALSARMQALWPEVEVLQAKQPAAAVEVAEGILAPLRSGERPEALLKQLAALKTQAQADHQARLAEAGEAPGARALHAGLIQRLGGQAESPIADLRAAAEVSVVPSAGTPGAGCAPLLSQVVQAAGRRGQDAAQVVVTLTRCVQDRQTSSRQEQYTYTEKIPYQVTERVKVRTESVVVKQKTCTQKNTARTSGHVTETVRTYDCSERKLKDIYEDRVVTRYREEQRTAQRTVRTERSKVSLAGSAQVSWEGGKTQIALSFDDSASDTAWSTPHGSKAIAREKSLEGLTQAAVRALASKAAEGAQKAVRASRAAAFEARAAQAEAAGDTRAAEDADVRAMVAAEGPTPGATRRLGARYGLSADGLYAALGGKAPTPTSAAWALSAKDKLELGASDKASFDKGEELLERGFAIGRAELGLRGMSSVDLPGQPDRTGLSFLLRTAYPLIGQAFMENGGAKRGLVLYDTLAFDFGIGGRTSDPWIYPEGKEESPYAWSFSASYQLLGGFRARWFGAMIGLRAQHTMRDAGSFTTGGSSYPVVARLELQVINRHPIFIEAYGLRVRGSGEVRGGELAYTLHNNLGLVVRAERHDLDARYSGNRELDVIDLGRQRSWIVDTALTLQF